MCGLTVLLLSSALHKKHDQSRQRMEGADRRGHRRVRSVLRFAQSAEAPDATPACGLSHEHKRSARRVQRASLGASFIEHAFLEGAARFIADAAA